MLRTGSPAGVGPQPLQEHGLADEDFFLHAMSLERKRSERSGKPFLLVLLRSAELFGGKPGVKLVRELQRGVLAGIREIDLSGWYEDEVALGIIFTELGGAATGANEAILSRITEAVVRTVGAETAAKIAITSHVFPSGTGNGQHGVGAETDDSMRFYPDVPRRERRRRSEYLIKRVMDVLGSLCALVLFSPVFLILAILIKLTSEGPVLFRQTRSGQYGKAFTFLKFRSMYQNNDAQIHQEYVTRFISGEQNSNTNAKVFKITNDPRVTVVGRFLRRTSLDELPQFINVLRGDMSLVGPRPPVAYEVEHYDVWHRRRLLEVRPGITGLWQVSGRSKVNFDEMVRLDLKYARKWSIAMDCKILWQTPKAVLSGEGAY